MMSGVIKHFKMMKILLSISSTGGGAAAAAAAEFPILFKNFTKNITVPWWLTAIDARAQSQTLGKCFALSAVAIFTAE